MKTNFGKIQGANLIEFKILGEPSAWKRSPWAKFRRSKIAWKAWKTRRWKKAHREPELPLFLIDTNSR